VLKYGYAHRLPAMGSFEHADLAGLDLMGDVAHDVWPDLSNEQDPDATLVGRLRAEGKLGMKSGAGFYDWTERDADAFRAGRDREIVRRLKILAGEG
jgi:3-hydroxybutyryl-CoA dehydrogenase